MPDDVRILADEVHAAVSAADPFGATTLGVPGHDAEVPDLSRAAEDAHAARMRALRDRALAVDVPGLTGADRVTHAAVVARTERELTAAATRSLEHTLSAMGHGPAALFLLAGSAGLRTPEQAEDLLLRTSRYPGYLAAHVERLQEGAAAGRFPVACLARTVLGQVDGYLAGEGPDALTDVAAPQGWDGGPQWHERLRAVVGEQVRPALARWRDAVGTLPTRSDDACGLAHVPGGEHDYARLVAVHTTLPGSADEVHALGRRSVDELVARMTELGRQVGLDGFPAVRDAAGRTRPEDAMAAARDAVRRAEAAVAGVFPEPLPPPCRVAAMSTSLARAGVPPHYTPPDEGSGKVGTYWFNAEQPGAGSGWDLEATAYHEAVPGHHLQLSRTRRLSGLPPLQVFGIVTAHAEGWGLYAEVLAGELGLYSSVQAELGALAVQLFRAARLVVDTGIHAHGWSRTRAVEELAAVVALPRAFVESEVNRYIAWPGQALAYLVGQREILRLRSAAQARLGERFDLRGFHGAVLDSGMLPLPAVGVAVDDWVARRAAA